MNQYFNKLIKLSEKAYKKGELPVGALITKNDKIISSAYNMKELKHNSTKHAEIIAIEKASKKISDWRLDECTLYTTMEPCLMCMGAIVESRIKTVICGCINKKYHKINKKICKDNNINMIFDDPNNKFEEIINNFFNEIRKK